MAPPPPPAPIEVAFDLALTLPLADPTVNTNPPLANRSLTGLATWLWVTNAADVTSTGAAGPIGVSVTAHPVATHWNLTDGTTDCDGLGRPFLFGQMEHDAQTDCSFTFIHRSTKDGDTFPALVVLDWAVSWSATDGTGGSFGIATTATPFRIRVEEGQSVTD